MRSLLIGLFMCIATIASADPRDWAKRIPCELQTAGVASLPTLTLLQGSSPLISADQYRSGKALTVTNDVQAVMRFSSSLTNTLWVSVTNQSYYSNSYLIQLPSLGTNAVNWVYTILYYKDSAIYWTGTGRLDIKATEVTGNALLWQQVVGCVTTADVNSAISTHNTNLTSHTNLLDLAGTRTMTGSIKYSTPFYDLYYTVDGLFKDGFSSDLYLRTPTDEEGDHYLASREWVGLQSYLTAETDPVWAGVSNTVTAGASLGATAVQRTGDTVTGALTTTVDQLTTPPAADEFVTGSFVRSLALSGVEWYFNNVTTNGFGEKTANFVALTATPPANLFTNATASPTPSNTYIAGGVTTNLYTALRSPISMEVYANRVGGNASTIIPIHAEIYYIYNGTTNHLGDWEVGNQNVTATIPTRYMFIVPFYEPAITGSVRVVAYLKTGTVSGTAAGLNIYGGGIYPSYIDIESVPTGITTHNDLSLRDASDAHPTSAITGLDSALAGIGVTPISTVATGAVVTVTPTQAKKLYEVTASTVITLTNDLASLNANGTTNYEWQTAINYTVTNALATTWDSRIEWIGLASTTPDLTVTGRYVFAFETFDGVTIKGRQVYPSVFFYKNMSINQGGNTTWAPRGSFAADQSLFANGGQVQDGGVFETDENNKKHIYQIICQGTAVPNITNIVQWSVIRGVSGQPFGASINFTKDSNNLIYFSFVPAYITSAYRVSYGFMAYRSNNVGVVSFVDAKKKQLNELEIKAYSQGWRP